MRNKNAQIKAFVELKRIGGTQAMRAGVFTGFDGRSPTCNCYLNGHHYPNCKISEVRRGYDLYMKYCKEK